MPGRFDPAPVLRIEVGQIPGLSIRRNGKRSNKTANQETYAALRSPQHLSRSVFIKGPESHAQRAFAFGGTWESYPARECEVSGPLARPRVGS